MMKLSLTEAATEIFKNGCTFYDRQIILLNTVFWGIPELKMPKLLIKGIYEKLDKLEKANPLRYIANDTKNKSTDFCLHFDPILGSGSLLMG